MLSQVIILPNVAYEFRMRKGRGDIKLLDETGDNALLYIGMKSENAPIIINTFIGGKWGAEVGFAHPPAGNPHHGVIWIKFNGTTLEIWTKDVTAKFDRFDPTSASNVRFMKMRNAEHPRDTMRLRVLSPDAMRFEINQYIIHERLNQIERLVNPQNPN